MTRETDGLARTPPMGWNSWNAYSCTVTEEDVRDAADRLVELGLRDAGYEYLVVDDCWMDPDLAEDGRLQAHPEDFPSGIESLAESVHDRGLKFGIYSSAGDETCQGYPASLGRERLHAEQFAAWGVDFLKYDNCGDHRGRDAFDRYRAMGAALEAVERDIVYSICEWGHNEPWRWGDNAGGHLWRSGDDIVIRWETENEFGHGICNIIDAAADPEIAGSQGPGSWNDPDMLQIGNDPESHHADQVDTEIHRGFTPAEERTHFTFWCLLGAPLMIGTTLDDMDERTQELLTNEDAIAIDQDPLGLQGTRDRVYGDREVWSKRLVDGECAVVLFNRGDDETTIETHVDEVDLPTTEADRYRVDDCWCEESWTTTGRFHDTVESHGVSLLVVSPIE